MLKGWSIVNQRIIRDDLKCLNCSYILKRKSICRFLLAYMKCTLIYDIQVIREAMNVLAWVFLYQFSFSLVFFSKASVSSYPKIWLCLNYRIKVKRIIKLNVITNYKITIFKC